MRLGLHSGIYAGGSFLVVVISFINVAVVTRFLDPSEFGRLALLLFFAALLTILYNLGSLQGTLMLVFGSTGEEEVDEDRVEDEDSDKRRLLGVGLTTTALVSILGTVLVVLTAAPIAELLLGDSGDADLVVIAALSGALGSIWRLTSNLLRMERRPVAFITLSSVRPVLVLAAVTWLLTVDDGVGSALAGVAIGTALSDGVALVVTRRSYTLAIDREGAWAVLRRGVFFVPIIVGFWVIQNVDLYLVSRYVSDAEAGYYRLATRIGAVVSYFTSAVAMAWGPLQFTSYFKAADAERGARSVRAAIVNYYAIVSVWLLLGLALAANTLVQIAPPAYANAAPLIPLLGGAFVAQGTLVAFYRAASFPRKRQAWTATVLGSAVVFLAAALILIPAWGGEGAAVAVIAGFAAGTFAIWAMSQRGPAPVPFDYARMGGAVALGGVCYLIAELAEPLAGSAEPAVAVLCLIAYPVLLVASGVVPRAHLDPLRRIAGELVPRRRRGLGAAVTELDERDREALRIAATGEDPVREAAKQMGCGEDEAGARLVAALRRAGSLDDGGSPVDAELATYLFTPGSIAERDAVARRLWLAGADPAEMVELEAVLEQVRRTPEEAWRSPESPI